MIRINITSVMVDDQAKAERFYTEVLGFEKNLDIPVHGARFLTVKNRDGSGVDLFLEPAGYEFAQSLPESAVRQWRGRDLARLRRHRGGI
jgi:catechol 2,3-dioxygenase-like lactoylglutathione lyase family enzyme